MVDSTTNEENHLEPNLHQKLKKLIKIIRKHKYAFPFDMPVDPIALGIYDYFEVIKHPMDLSTVERKVNEYLNLDQFLSDVKLIWLNCYLYNPPESDICKMAKELEGYCNELFESSKLVESFNDKINDKFQDLSLE